jgi:hypothetical protein
MFLFFDVTVFNVHVFDVTSSYQFKICLMVKVKNHFIFGLQFHFFIQAVNFREFFPTFCHFFVLPDLKY